MRERERESGRERQTDRLDQVRIAQGESCWRERERGKERGRETETDRQTWPGENSTGRIMFERERQRMIERQRGR